MSTRLPVAKTYKLFINGKFPRSESGRTIALTSPSGAPIAHVCRASRKDLRDAVEAARGAFTSWRDATAYLRGQILYRAAEMLEARRHEFIDLLASSSPAAASGAAPDPVAEVDAAIERLIAFAGWADKHAQVLGCNNPVAGPYYNFTVPQPTGVVAVVAPDAPALLSLISLMAPPLCAGNTIVALAGESSAAHLAAVVFAEVVATSDIPPGVVNILTGVREELVPQIASHRGIDAVHAAGLSPDHAAALRAGSAQNLKRVTVREAPATPAQWLDADSCHSPWWIEPFLEMKTIWHPSAT